MPTSILWGTAKKIDIVYDAVGGQLSCTVYTGAVVDYKQDCILPPSLLIQRLKEEDH